MRLNVIIKVIGDHDPRGLRHYLLERYRLDFTDLIEQTLAHWDVLETGDEDLVRDVLAQYLNKRLSPRRKMEYADLYEAAARLSAGLYQLHGHLGNTLTPLSEQYCRGLPYNLRLRGFIGLDKAAIIEVSPRFA